MDALLLSFFLCALTEAFGAVPLLFAQLGKRFGNGPALWGGLLTATGANAAIAALAGSLIVPMLTPEARALFLALALAAGALPLMRKAVLSDSLARWRIGAFPTAALGLFILGFGESPTFLVAGIAVAHADPWMAGIGGGLGSAAACIVLSVAPFPDPLPRPASLIRWGVAFTIFIVAFLMAMSALRLF